jgi:hygromycin-B 7''-O-kinase
MISSPLPPIQSTDELDALRADRDRWLPAVSAIARAHELAEAPLSDLGGGNLVIGAGDRHVIKLVPPLFAHELVAERVCLELLKLGERAPTWSSLPIPTPALLGAGERDGWTYLLLSRLPGSPLRSRWDEVPKGEREPILRALGGFLAALHALPAPPDGSFAAPWPAFVEAESAAYFERQARWGVAPEILAGGPACLARAQLDSPGRVTLLHADLNDMNVLIDETEGGFRASGVIDFADARVGDPLFDLITPALLIARGDRALFHALLDGYGLSPDERTPALQAKLTAFALLHPFNKLTRYTGWGPRPAASLDELTAIMFPL